MGSATGDAAGSLNFDVSSNARMTICSKTASKTALPYSLIKRCKGCVTAAKNCCPGVKLLGQSQTLMAAISFVAVLT